MSEINIGKISEALNNKADTSLLNTDQNTDSILAYQKPTAENNYTWYRIYKSGWVEQGGKITGISQAVIDWTEKQITLPLTMSDTNYDVIATDCGIGSENWSGTNIDGKSVNNFYYRYYNANANAKISWEAKGQGDPNAIRNAIIDKMIEAGTSINYNIANLTDYIIAYQEPTAQNDYTWYRVYNSGWVEQGGISDWKVTITLSIVMSDTNYCVQISGNMTNASTLGYPVDATNKTINGFYLGTRDTGSQQVAWEVKGQGDPEVIAEMIANSAISNAVNTYIIEKQLPTAENDYTWYRKYSDGWVEQGGHYTHDNIEKTVTINLPVIMYDSHYTITMSKELGSSAETDMSYQFMPAYVKNSKTTTNFQVRMTENNRLNGMDWEVKGMAAEEVPL